MADKGDIRANRKGTRAAGLAFLHHYRLLWLSRGGRYGGGHYGDFGNRAYYLDLVNGIAIVDDNRKGNAFSVRCLKDSL